MNFYPKMKQDQEKSLKNIVSMMERDDAFDAPADAVKWAKNLFLTRVAAPKASFVQKVLAVLQMDLSPDTAVFGERSAASSQTRQMLFAAGDNRIDLRIAKSGKSFKVNGQIFGENFGDAEIKLSSADEILTANTNELSEFKFTNVATGKYSLSFIKDEREIVIENIEIG